MEWDGVGGEGGEKVRGKEIEGAAMGGGAGEKNKEKQIDILKRFCKGW